VRSPPTCPSIQAIKFIMNPRTARAFGPAVPPTLLALADEVIE
jgi:hypothetical protein